MQTRPRRNPRAQILAAVAVLSTSAMAQDNSSTPEVRVQASAVIKKQTGQGANGAPIETAVVAMRVSYGDLSLDTRSGQSLLRDRVAEAARDACARVGSVFPPGGQLTEDAECIRTAIKDAKSQVDGAIAAANAGKAVTR